MRKLDFFLKSERAYRPGSVEDLEKVKDGDHKRRKEMLVLKSGILLSIALATVGACVALAPKTDPVIRAVAAGWVGVVLGQCKKVWGGD
jgi:hypothetical protein